MTTEYASQFVADPLPFARLLAWNSLPSPRIVWKLCCKSARNSVRVQLCCMGER